jgi:LysR family hca operon transcriptional activator
VASTRGVALLPNFARNFLTWSVISRPLAGEVPSIVLVVGYTRPTTRRSCKAFRYAHLT